MSWLLMLLSNDVALMHNYNIIFMIKRIHPKFINIIKNTSDAKLSYFKALIQTFSSYTSLACLIAW